MDKNTQPIVNSTGGSRKRQEFAGFEKTGGKPGDWLGTRL
jgi:hypothetical protein